MQSQGKKQNFGYMYRSKKTKLKRHFFVQEVKQVGVRAGGLEGDGALDGAMNGSVDEAPWTEHWMEQRMEHWMELWMEQWMNHRMTKDGALVETVYGAGHWTWRSGWRSRWSNRWTTR